MFHGAIHIKPKAKHQVKMGNKLPIASHTIPPRATYHKPTK